MKKMNTLQVQNTFEPYYAGRDSDTARWKTHRRNGDKTEAVKVEHGEETRGPVKHAA